MMMKIKILGTGCPKCKAMEKVVRKVIEESKINVEVQRVDDIMEIIGYGIMMTPALVVDEQVIIKGYVPSVKEVKKILFISG